MIVYIVFFFFFFLALINEMKDIGCMSPARCQIKESPFIRDCVADSLDSATEALEKIKNGLTYNDKFILWRINFIGATISFIFLWFIIIGEFPSERNLVLGVLIIMFVFYFIGSFYNFHVRNPIKENLEKNISNFEKLCSYQNKN